MAARYLSTKIGLVFMKRTSDGRFIANRIQLSGKFCNQLLCGIKKEKSWTWKQFAKQLGVSEHTLSHDWRYGESTLPEHIFRKLNQLSKSDLDLTYKKLPAWWGQKIGQKSKFDNLVTLPDLSSSEFAEFYGAMLGDGCIYTNMNSICITCNGVLDRWYVESFLRKLCAKLFNITPKVYYTKNEKTIRLIVNCRNISKFFVGLGFPKGKKKAEKIGIPKFILEDNSLIIACLRGLADTDGGIYPHPNSRIMLDVTSKIPSLLNSLHEAAKKIGLKPGITKDRIQLYGEKQLKNYFSLIGSSNPRNMLKYQIFLKTNSVPKTAEIENLLKEHNSKWSVPYHGLVI